MLRNRAALRTASEQKVTGYASATNGNHDYYAALEKVEKKGCSGRRKKRKNKTSRATTTRAREFAHVPGAAM